METRAHHVVVGLFTVLTVTAALLFGLWLAHPRGNDRQKIYQVQFNEAVSGLSQGGAVQYNGINVGDIRQLSLDPRDPRHVIAIIRVSMATPIKQDTHAKLMLTSVTGGAVIMLSAGNPNAADLATSPEQPGVIIADPSPLSRLLNNGEDLMTNVNDLLGRLDNLLSAQNVAHVSATLQHVDELTAALADQRDDLRNLVSQLNRTAVDTQATIAQAHQLLSHSDAILQHQGQQTLQQTQATMTHLAQISSQLQTFMDQNQQALGRSVQGAAQIGPLADQLQRTLIELRQLGNQLQAEPSVLLRGKDHSKEFTP